LVVCVGGVVWVWIGACSRREIGSVGSGACIYVNSAGLGAGVGFDVGGGFLRAGEV